MKARAVFLDRDGVLIREVNYLKRPEQVRLIKGAAGAVAALRRGGFKAVVITNQSAVARGYITVPTLAKVHARLRRDLKAAGAKLDALYFCPHHPQAGAKRRCRCRKPAPGMVLQAARDLKLDLKRSYFVGDTTTDMATASAAGCPGLLVRTGKAGRDGKYPAKPARVFRDLAAAARWILAQALGFSS